MPIGWATTSVAISDLLNPALWVYEGLGVRKSTSGVDVSPDKALSISAVFAGVRAIAEDTAKVPLILYRRTAGRKERATDDPLYRLLHNAPNPESTSITFREALAATAILFGNGYAEIVRENGRPVELWPIWSPRVAVKRDDTGSLYYSVYGDDGRWTDLPQEDVIHVRAFSTNGVTGEMITRLGSESLGLAIAAEQFGAAFFGNGSTFGRTFKHPSEWSDEAVTNFRRSIQSMHGSANKAFLNLLIDEAVQVQDNPGVDPEKAQLTSVRYFQIEEVARWLRIPPHKLAHLERATYSNIEQQSLDYWQDTLFAWFARIEQEFNRKLMPSSGELYCEHLLDSLLRADAKTRAEVHQIEFMNGALTQNEWRSQENRNPIGKDGDVHYRPVNLAPNGTAPVAVNVPEPPSQNDGARNVADAFVAPMADIARRLINRECNGMVRKEMDMEAQSALVVDALTPLCLALWSLLNDGPVSETVAERVVVTLRSLSDQSHDWAKGEWAKARASNSLEQTAEHFKHGVRAEGFARGVVEAIKELPNG